MRSAGISEGRAHRHRLPRGSLGTASSTVGVIQDLTDCFGLSQGEGFEVRWPIQVAALG